MSFPLNCSLLAAAIVWLWANGNPVLAKTIVVTNAGDDHVDGQVSLREAVASSSAGDVITFQVESRVLLHPGEIQLGHDLTLQGPTGRTQFVQMAHPPSGFSTRILKITAGTIDIRNVTFARGVDSGQNGSGTAAAGDGQGGAIQNFGVLKLTDCQFQGNAAQGGQGFWGSEGLGPSAPGKGQGGAIYNAGTLEARRCLFSFNGANGGVPSPPGLNGADGAGGAIFSVGSATIINCTFEENLAQGSNDGPKTSSPSRSGNAKGGAIFNAGSLTVQSATICNNYAQGGNGNVPGESFGGGLMPSDNGVGQTTLQNTIVAKNRSFIRGFLPPDSPTYGNDVYGPVVSLGHNLIGDANDSVGWQPTDQLGKDPLIQRFAFDNGGPARTLALRSGSPAIDQGINAGLTTDGRGLPRTYDDSAVANVPGGDGTDIGAFELQPAAPAILQNISARLHSLAGDGVLIGGLTITGSGPKRILFRALGSQLAGHGIPNVMSDPVLELRSADGSVIATNDDWDDSQGVEIEALGLYPLGPADSGILISLDPGVYSALVRGKEGHTGVTLFEAYDLQPYAMSRFSNLSVRGLVGTETDVVIDGFMLAGDGGGSTKVVVRVLGPSLSAYNLSALQDPTISLHDDYGTQVAFNDNWKDIEPSEIAATGLAPSHDLESAIVDDLPPGGYTAIARGKNNTTGIGLVEVYKLQ